jgi:hypothetical protein
MSNPWPCNSYFPYSDNPEEGRGTPLPSFFLPLAFGTAFVLQGDEKSDIGGAIIIKVWYLARLFRFFGRRPGGVAAEEAVSGKVLSPHYFKI